MRLQKFMAQCGIASRRKSEEIIISKRVKVNGKVITELGYKIDPLQDIVTVDGKRIRDREKKVYIMMNKPKGYVTTVSDEFNRKTVLDLVKDIKERVYPIGRLDFDTSGLLLLTNDGELAYKLIHPKFEVVKTYIATIKGRPSEEELERFRHGLEIDGYITSKAEIEILSSIDDKSVVRIKIHEGKNRQIRKMCDKIGHPVTSLKRISIGNLELGTLKKGCWRYLDNDEIEYLKKI
ncbi:ribosomal large subunit pseudouridine synthase B [Proteiniborus sp. DW1]|uniref:pseudouridine synthase n=1 Tax=Proteiniborus sp. DW1 TaxID=1889883 RepID=UPI00092E022A|nr:pseudouridine synthase [Proteiniborus sp. DW1]SCG83345.1 ribosomal large subunit pseudouridine synthase B [Proteiniborus sp. DW1]